jgi:hypothetical protein
MPDSEIGEILVTQGKQRLVLRAAQFECHQRFWHPGEGTLPPPGIDEPLRRPHLEKLAADGYAAAGIPGPDHRDPVEAADAQIDLDLVSRPPGWAPPLAQRDRLCPSTEHPLRRRPEATLQFDA